MLGEAPARTEDAFSFAQVHVTSWRAIYSGYRASALPGLS